MFKRTAVILALALAGTTGVALAFQSPSHATPVTAAAKVAQDQHASTGDADPNAACVTSAAGEQTGDCADSQVAGANDGEPNGEAEASAPDGDTIQFQSGDQTSP